MNNERDSPSTRPAALAGSPPGKPPEAAQETAQEAAAPPVSSTRPSSASVFWGEWRRGLKDLQNAALDPWNGVTQTHEEPGTIASPTQAVVTQEIGTVHGYQQMLEDYASRSPPESEKEREFSR